MNDQMQNPELGPDLPPAPVAEKVRRRTLLQLAGAGAVAAGLVGVSGSPAHAGPTEPARPLNVRAAPTLITYPRPAEMAANPNFTVRARGARGGWQPVDVYRVNLTEIDPNTGSGPTRASSLAYFDFTGVVEVQVTYHRARVTDVRIRPDALNLDHDRRGNRVSLTLDTPRDLVIQVNGEVFDCLHLITNSIETDQPSPGDPDVIYFGAGMHTVAGGVLMVPSGKTVYLAGGAVLTAQVFFKDAQSAGLRGHGMLHNGGSRCENGTDITISDIIQLNAKSLTVAESERVRVTKWRTFNYGAWGDGFDIFSCTDVVLDGCFIRSSDDSIAIYTHRWDWYGDVRNVMIKNCTLWADVAHPINVGTHGNTENPETIENITFSNIDILDHREPQMHYQGCLALNPGDANLIRQVRVENLRVEDFRWGRLIDMRVQFNKKYNTSAGRGIEDVYLKNVSYTGTGANPSMFLGYDAEHAIKDVTFENLVINGRVIADSMRKPGWYAATDVTQWFVNDHVENLRFLTTAEA